MPEKLKDNSDEHEVSEEAHSRGGGDFDMGIATMTRRSFLGKVGKAARDVGVGIAAGAIGGGVAGFGVWSWRDAVEAHREWQKRDARQKKKEEKARELFEELFGGPGELRHSYDGNHPDNAVAEKILRPVLGLYDREPQPDYDGSNRKIDLEGPLVTFGGPNSTPLTALAWEFRGRNKRELDRDPDAVIPLRFYGMSNEKDQSLPRYRIRYTRADKRSFPTIPWPFMDKMCPDNPVTPKPGKFLEEIMDQQGETRGVHLPLDNYLLVTRLPNYLGGDRQGMPSSWPQLLVFEGNNGIGTRGAELLWQPVGVEALEELKKKLEGATAFQGMFRLSKIDEDSHRFLDIELLDWSVTPLNISREDYHKANAKVLERLHGPAPLAPLRSV